MKSSVVPLLRYVEPARAIDWLCAAFGFEVFLRVPGPDGRIVHARLILENGMIMLASLGRGGAFEDHFRAPREAGGVTQCSSMFVRDPARVFARAQAAGARIIDTLQDSQVGGQLFSCEDLEQHVWVFSSHDPWQLTW